MAVAASIYTLDRDFFRTKEKPGGKQGWRLNEVTRFYRTFFAHMHELHISKSFTNYGKKQICEALCKLNIDKQVNSHLMGKFKTDFHRQNTDTLTTISSK